MPHQAGANNDPNDQEGREVARNPDDVPINVTLQPVQSDSNNPNDQERESLKPWFTIYTAFMAIQIAILGMHFQGSSSPFIAHPARMWTFVFAMFINVGAALYYAKSRIRGSRRSEFCDLVGYISGSFASVVFLSILVPPSLVPVVFVIWMLHLPIYFDTTCGWILSHLPNIWNRNRGSHNDGANNPAN